MFQGGLRVIRRAADETAGRPKQSARLRGGPDPLPADEEACLLDSALREPLNQLLLVTQSAVTTNVYCKIKARNLTVNER